MFIKHRVKISMKYWSALHVRYGIDAYFVLAGMKGCKPEDMELFISHGFENDMEWSEDVCNIDKLECVVHGFNMVDE